LYFHCILLTAEIFRFRDRGSILLPPRELHSSVVDDSRHLLELATQFPGIATRRLSTWSPKRKISKF